MGCQGIFLWHQFQVLKLLLMLSSSYMYLFAICLFSTVKCWFKSTGFCFLLNCLLSYSQIVRALLYTGYKVFLRNITCKYVLWIYSFYFFLSTAFFKENSALFWWSTIHQFSLCTLAMLLYVRNLIPKEAHNEYWLENRSFVSYISHLDFTVVCFITFYNRVFDIGRGSCLHL
jgi:hypothetical protein